MKDKTIEMSGKVQNMDVKLKIVQKAPNKIYAETEMVGMFKQQQGFDGKHGWAVSPQGTKDLSRRSTGGDQIRIHVRFLRQVQSDGIQSRSERSKKCQRKGLLRSKFFERFGEIDADSTSESRTSSNTAM